MIAVSDKAVPTSRILVVEDDAEMRSLLTDELLDEGYEVLQAVDGEDAASRLVQERFDLVITDVVMPRSGGLDLLSNVRKVYPNMPVILITAFGDWSSLVKAYEEGAFNYICKPFKIAELKDSVRKALKK